MQKNATASTVFCRSRASFATLTRPSVFSLSVGDDSPFLQRHRGASSTVGRAQLLSCIVITTAHAKLSPRACADADDPSTLQSAAQQIANVGLQHPQYVHAVLRQVCARECKCTCLHVS